MSCLNTEGCKAYKLLSQPRQPCKPLNDLFYPLFRLYKITSVFIFGAMINLLFTLVGKAYLGELRPHFLAVCKPNMSLVNCSEGYVTNYECTGKDFAAIEKAR